MTGVSNYARLHHSPLRTSVGAVIAGFGEQGDGNTGGNGFPDFLTTGLNTLDAVAGASITAGNGAQTNVFPATPASVVLMDFDQWTNRVFLFVNPTNSAFLRAQAVALSAFSFMGENEASHPMSACAGVNQPVPGYFRATVCDFFPAAGDSGGPALLWPGSLRLLDTGYFLPSAPEVVGVMSFVNTGAGTTNTGVLVLGNSDQLFDITGAAAGAITNGAAMVLKLPFDGRVPLHPNSRTIHHFLQPGVHDSLYDQETVGLPSPDADYLGTYPLTLASATQNIGAANSPTTPTPATALVSIRLEAGNANLPMSYDTWAYYHFLSPGSGVQDTDGDGLDNATEFFFGTDPRAATPSTAAALTIDYTNAVVGLGFARALAATNSPFEMQTSTNLVDWQAVTHGTLQSLGASNLVERLRLRLPAPDPAAFYRLFRP